MVNRHRMEFPGAWHHVMNRGTARRTVIEHTSLVLGDPEYGRRSGDTLAMVFAAEHGFGA